MTQRSIRAFIDSFYGIPLPSEFFQSSIGFDRLFHDICDAAERLADHSSYPPHNIRKTGEQKYAIELAVAGFTPEELEVSMERQVLMVKGTRPQTSQDQEYVHRGLALRSFEKRIPLVDTIVIQDVVLQNGMLSIHVENVIPEKEKKRIMNIKTV